MSAKKFKKFKEPTVQKINYIGLKHEGVSKKFDGNPVFVNYTSMKGEDCCTAVYFCRKPNRKKGHKSYLLITSRYNPLIEKSEYYVRGRDENEFKPEERYRSALLCKRCNTVAYSIYRHDFHYCACGDCFVDGGGDYFRCGFKSRETYESVTLDVLTGVSSPGHKPDRYDEIADKMAGKV